VRLEGNMAKKVSEKKLFQKSSYPIRYHIIDFNSSMLIIKKDADTNENDKNNKIILFRDIISTYIPGDDDECQI